MIEEKIKKISDNFQEKYKNESIEDRATRWVLGTIKWHYEFQYIFASGACNREVIGENFEKLSKEKKDYLIKTCSEAYKPFKKYLLVNTCYLFGAYYELCKRNNIEFKEDKVFLKNQFNNFYQRIGKLYKNPDKQESLWMPIFDEIFHKNNLNVNKNFFLALYPPLKENEIESIISWFLENWKKNNKIKMIFDTARNYFHLEEDENSPFKKITEKNDFVETTTFTCDSDSELFESSIVNSNIPLRLTYFFLASSTLEEINKSYLLDDQNKRKWKIEKLISNIIQNGPNLIFQVEIYKNI